MTFHMTTNGIAGAEQPGKTVSLGGAPVFAYVWPTSLDPAVIGFEGGTGILALAATSHPDFDDTPSSTRTTMVTRPMTGSSGTATGLS